MASGKQTAGNLKGLLDQLRVVHAALRDARSLADGLIPAGLQHRIGAAQDDMLGLDATIRQVWWELTDPAAPDLDGIFAPGERDRDAPHLGETIARRLADGAEGEGREIAARLPGKTP